MPLTRNSGTWYIGRLASPAEGASQCDLARCLPARASAGPGGFSSEQPAGTPYKHQSNWEPTVATDPSHPDLVYQLLTGINAHQCAPGCPGTSVLFRKSADGGTTWGAEQFVCGLACKGV